MKRTTLSERALVLAPRGRDAAIAAAMLGEAGVSAHACASLPSLIEQLDQGAGLVVVTEEALATADLAPLVAWIADQQEWSDLPFVLLTNHGGGLERNPAARRFLDVLGNVTFLERPFHPTTLVSLAQSALRGRRRQYEARSRLEVLRTTETALRQLNETLEARVEERTTELNRLWSLSQDMLARADYQGMMSAVSPAWSRVLGWSEAELLTRPYAAFMHPEDIGSTLDALARMGETGEPTRFENRIATKGGGWKPIEWVVAPEPDGANFIAVGRDLSAVREREAELQIAQEALRQSQKMEAMGQLTGGVAHDFNNLLTPIMGSLDRLLTRKVGSEREQQLMAGALEAAERAKVLVQRLLAFARRQPLQATAVNLPQLVHGLADLISATLGPRIEVRVEIAPDLPPASADGNQLEMALLNLAVNARDAMPEGGTLTISAFRESVRGRHGSGLKTGHYVRLTVADTGTGMDEATLSRAVEPFFSTKGVGRGTGLGLSMVHGLAAQLGGGLTVRSKPGQGTTVELWLPLSAEPVGEATAAPTLPPLGEARGHVLLVDDEDLVRMSTAQMLMDLGFVVVEAGSAEHALHLMRTGTAADVLITDHLMPGMSGAQLAREAQVLRPGMPILIVSGYTEMEGLTPDLPRLVKPFRAAELAERVAAVLPGLQGESRS